MKDMVDQAISKLGENIAIRRFSRFKIGEADAGSGTPSASDPDGSDSSRVIIFLSQSI